MSSRCQSCYACYCSRHFSLLLVSDICKFRTKNKAHLCVCHPNMNFYSITHPSILLLWIIAGPHLFSYTILWWLFCRIGSQYLGLKICIKYSKKTILFLRQASQLPVVNMVFSPRYVVFSRRLLSSFLSSVNDQSAVITRPINNAFFHPCKINRSLPALSPPRPACTAPSLLCVPRSALAYCYQVVSTWQPDYQHLQHPLSCVNQHAHSLAT